MKAILAMVILLSFVGCTDEREPQRIDICTACDPLTQAPAEGERNKNPEGKKGKNPIETGVIDTIFPASNAEGVQLDTKISIVFNKDIDPSELTSAHFYLTNSRGEEIESTLVYTDRKVTLAPLKNLNLLTTYTLSLEGAKTLAGRQIDKKTWKFTTRDGVWGAPLALQIETRKESYGGKIVADQHGNAVAIWPQYENFKAQLWQARYEEGRWFPSYPLEVHGSDYSSIRYKLAMDSGGQAAASWISHWGTGRMGYSFMAPSGAWGAARILPDQEILEQDIAMSENDQTLLSSITKGEDAKVFFVMFDSQSSDISSFQVLPCDWQCRYTEGAFDDEGHAYVVVEKSREGQYSEISVGAFDGEQWQMSLIKEAGNGDSADPRLAMSKGRPYVFWSQWGEDAGVWMRKFQGGRWLPEERMSAKNETTMNLKVESNIFGDMVATWTEGENNPYLFANVYNAKSGEWTGARRIDVGDGELYAPGVVIDNQGNVTLGWSQSKDYNNYTESLYTARYDFVQAKWSEGKKVEGIYLALKTAPSLTALNDGRVFLLTGQLENIWNTVVLEFK